MAARLDQVIAAAQSPTLNDVTDLEPDQTVSANLSASALATFNIQHPRELPPKLLPEASSASVKPDISVDPATEVDGNQFPEYSNNQEFDGLMANNTIYGTFSVPAGTHGNGLQNTIYAPTMKGTRTCLEVSSEYYNGEQYYTVFDFCSGSGGAYVVVKQTNTAFFNSYVRELNGNTTPQYSTYTVSFYPGVVTACENNSAQCDVAALYNYTTKNYDVIYVRVEGNTQGYTQGWDWTETHLPSGDCPAIPVFETSQTMEWEHAKGGYITPSPSNSGEYSINQINCPWVFNDTFADSTGWYVEN